MTYLLSATKLLPPILMTKTPSL